MAGLNVASVVFALGKSLVLANFFGTSRLVEVYFAATTLLMIVTKLTQSGSLAGIFLPVYVQIKNRDGDRSAHKAFSVVLNWTLIAATALCVLLWWAAPVLVALLVPGFEASDQALTLRMFRWLIPLVGIMVVYSFLQMQANAERRFGQPEAVNLGERVISIVVLLLLMQTLGGWALIVALWAGNVASFIGYAAVSRGTGYRHHFILRLEGFSVWSALFDKFLHTVGYVGAAQLSNFVITAGLSTLPQGTFAVYKYVSELYLKTNSALLRPVSVIFYTQISEALAKGWSNVKEIAHVGLARLLTIWAVVFVAMTTAGRPALGGLWGSDRFGAEDLDLAAKLLIVLFSLTVVEVVQWILHRVNLASGSAKAQYNANTIAQLVTALSAWVLIPAFGIVGAIVVFTIERVATTLGGWIILWTKQRLVLFYPPGILWRWALCMAGGLAIGYLMAAVAGDVVIIQGRIGELVRAIWIAGGAVGATLAAAWLLGVHEVRVSGRGISRMISVLNPYS